MPDSILLKKVEVEIAEVLHKGNPDQYSQALEQFTVPEGTSLEDAISQYASAVNIAEAFTSENDLYRQMRPFFAVKFSRTLSKVNFNLWKTSRAVTPTHKAA
ncbi:hypothetical protein JKP88DRAFT_252567 [Tribonema minus]|uniref:Uncharacterized protein n=1 Tax=Tribonema minus TaxID=303371 RepID=A0A835ZCS5_9STRA|nr:hypothetical protein JKP88DRAFT_252567 [Tribonema minus]